VTNLCPKFRAQRPAGGTISRRRATGDPRPDADNAAPSPRSTSRPSPAACLPVTQIAQRKSSMPAFSSAAHHAAANRRQSRSPGRTRLAGFLTEIKCRVAEKHRVKVWEHWLDRRTYSLRPSSRSASRRNRARGPSRRGLPKATQSERQRDRASPLQSRTRQQEEFKRR
jgi:hypothetical protein